MLQTLMAVIMVFIFRNMMPYAMIDVYGDPEERIASIIRVER
jgi:hypothetical protein